MPRRRKDPVSLSGDDRGRLEGLIAGGHGMVPLRIRRLCWMPGRIRA
jgi:hypothetical protein